MFHSVPLQLFLSYAIVYIFGTNQQIALQNVLIKYICKALSAYGLEHCRESE